MVRLPIHPKTQDNRKSSGWVGDEVGGDREGGLGVLDKILKRGRVGNIGGLHKIGGSYIANK